MCKRLGPVLVRRSKYPVLLLFLLAELIPAPPALQQAHVRPVDQGQQPTPQERQLRQGAEAQQQQHPHGE